MTETNNTKSCKNNQSFKDILLNDYDWSNTVWTSILSDEMKDGTLIMYDNIADWLMVADYFTHR